MIDPRKPDVVTVAVRQAGGGLTVLRVIVAEYEPDGEGGRRKRWEADPTPDYIDALIAKYDWQGDQRAVSWRLVANDFVPEDTPKSERYFRNAWKDDGGSKPGVDMPKAREIHRVHLRRLRAPLLEALDNEYLRADEAGDQQTKKQVAAKKQELRDITADPRIEAAQTPEELKAVLPDALRG
jgi:hypothetical protein